MLYHLIAHFKFLIPTSATAPMMGSRRIEQVLRHNLEVHVHVHRTCTCMCTTSSYTCTCVGWGSRKEGTCRYNSWFMRYRYYTCIYCLQRTCTVHLQLAMIPRFPDLVIFVWTTTATTNDRIDYFTPCACANTCTCTCRYMYIEAPDLYTPVTNKFYSWWNWGRLLES
jgi:hypothetical protein